MQEPFESIWHKIEAHEGQTFRTIRGLEFTYRIDGNRLIPNWPRNKYPLHLTNFQIAYEGGRVPGPGSFERTIQGSSYVWAMLDDKRIAGGQW